MREARGGRGGGGGEEAGGKDAGGGGGREGRNGTKEAEREREKSRTSGGNKQWAG